MVRHCKRENTSRSRSDSHTAPAYAVRNDIAYKCDESHKFYGITMRCFNTKRSAIVSKNKLDFFVIEGKQGVESICATVECKECGKFHVLRLATFN